MKTLDEAIRKVPDFPKPGVCFYDVTGILAEPDVFTSLIDRMAETYKDKQITKVACIEARGFLFAAPFAYKLSLPLVLMRKKGKLPNHVHEKTFALEYGTDVLTVQDIDVAKGDNVLIIDDLLATGGTIKAASELVEECGGTVAGIFGVIGLPYLPYREVLKDYDVVTFQDYYGE